MGKIVRLENVHFGLSSILKDEVDKVLEFDSDDGGVNVHVLEKPCRIPFEVGNEEILTFVREVTEQDFDVGMVRIIHNLPVSNAYSAPFKIYLDITTECQLKCPFCLSETRDGVAVSLPLATLKQIATEIRELGVMYVKIGGGDPLLHPNFLEILGLLRSTDCFITFSTNSIMMTPEIAKLLAETNVRTSVSIARGGVADTYAVPTPPKIVMTTGVMANFAKIGEIVNVATYIITSDRIVPKIILTDGSEFLQAIK